MPVFLHVGCGGKRQDQTTRGFARPEWRELRLDIDPAVAPDLVGTMTEMAAMRRGAPAPGQERPRLCPGAL